LKHENVPEELFRIRDSPTGERTGILGQDSKSRSNTALSVIEIEIDSFAKPNTLGGGCPVNAGHRLNHPMKAANRAMQHTARSFVMDFLSFFILRPRRFT
jgi:hypothetical protein